MKSVGEMSQGELAAYIDTHLRERGIQVVLSGGACVAIYSENKYISKGLDFIARFALDHKRVEAAMQEIGFHRQGRYYHHPGTSFYVEFMSGPPSVGEDPIGEILELDMSTGTLRIISPTDAVKDRLAAFYHWGDRQSLEQALLVALSKSTDLQRVKEWSDREGKGAEFEEFRRRLQS